jgi:hypothetical protein
MKWLWYKIIGVLFIVNYEKFLIWFKEYSVKSNGNSDKNWKIS